MLTIPILPDAPEIYETASSQIGACMLSVIRSSSNVAIGQLFQYACLPALPSAISLNLVVRNKLRGSSPGCLYSSKELS